MARSVSRLGVDVYAINASDSPMRYSRCCQLITLGGEKSADIWSAFLLGSESDHLKGAVLLAASDAAIELIIRQRDELAKRYVLDISSPEAQLCMLNKLTSYRAATEAGVPTPKYWQVETLEDVNRISHELVFPLIVKPHLSHVFVARFGRKFVLANNLDELMGLIEDVFSSGVGILLMEKIVGPDDLLCSYYTYLDDQGQPLFDFTKRVIRRYPANEGLACYHITDKNPEVREVALKFMRHVGLRGLGNVEFKRDVRDGQLKLIECNARFTAANMLVTAAGFDLGQFVYKRLAGWPLDPLTSYRSGLRLWNPIEDFKAYKELSRQNSLTLFQWLCGVCHVQVLPVWSWHDPAPTVMREAQRIARGILKLLGLRHHKIAAGVSPQPASSVTTSKCSDTR
ncbi:MAG: ATP-grasp domain-containing protein [Hyphomicrobiales bacterium]|nr:ATP-grasp domain-containing protein [Hyphomicrobiales bacterium]